MRVKGDPGRRDHGEGNMEGRERYGTGERGRRRLTSHEKDTMVKGATLYDDVLALRWESLLGARVGQRTVLTGSRFLTEVKWGVVDMGGDECERQLLFGWRFWTVV